MALRIIFFVFLLFTTAHAQEDITVKISNKSNHAIEYKIDNFKYIDRRRVWRTLPAVVSAMETVYFTTKWGYLELQIKDPVSSQIIERYIPSGNNKEITIIIENDDDNIFNQLKASRYLGFK